MSMMYKAGVNGPWRVSMAGVHCDKYIKNA